MPGTLILVFTNFISFLGWLNYFSPVISRSPEQRYPSGPWQPLFTLGRVPCEISRGSQNGQNCLLYAYISIYLGSQLKVPWTDVCVSVCGGGACVRDHVDAFTHLPSTHGFGRSVNSADRPETLLKNDLTHKLYISYSILLWYSC